MEHTLNHSKLKKKQLLSASALPLKLCTLTFDRNTSFISLHKQLKRATPDQMMIYKHALLLHKTYNVESKSSEWLDLFMNQTFNNRILHANFLILSNFKIGKNLQSNRFPLLNNKISYESLNQNFAQFKVLCKELFIMNL